MQNFQMTSTASAKRLDLWNTHLSDLFAGLVADPEEPDNFDGNLCWSDIGPLTGALASASRCKMHHPAALASGQESTFILKVQLCGRALAEHVGEEALLAPGDMILFDSDQTHRLTLLEDSEMLALCVPKALAQDKIATLEPLAGLRLPADNPSVRLCASFAESLWRLSQDGYPARLPSGSANILCDLLGMCGRGENEETQRVHRADWSTITQYMHDRLLEPELSVAQISAELGVTSRRLQQIFAAKGTTPGRHVLEERLKEARRRLSDPHLADLSITAIAFDVGFGDITYFGRAFRARYRETPVAFRRSVRKH